MSFYYLRTQERQRTGRQVGPVANNKSLGMAATTARDLQQALVKAGLWDVSNAPGRASRQW